MKRRDLLGGGVGAGLASAAWAAPPGAEGTAAVTDVASLAAMAVPPAQPVLLTQPGREGWFVSAPGAQPIVDPLQGLYVASRGGDWHWRRLWDGRAGRPEWFGARPNVGGADCASSIEACVALCPITLLSQADYFIRRTLTLDRSFRTIVGCGRYAANQGQGTRIILQGSAAGIHDADLMLVGSRNQPGPTDASFAQEIHLSDFTLIRDGASAPHSTGDLRRYPAGLRAAFLTRCSFARISSLESAIGFYFGGTVYTKVEDCLAQRLAPGQTGGVDLAAGFFLDGSPRIGLAGGNASLYLDRCLTVGQHPAHVRPTGLIAEGAFVDSFVDRFESARIDSGMRFSAASAGGGGQTLDLHLRGCVLDGCGSTGLEIDLTGTESASVEIIDPYIYAATGGGSAGLVIRNGGGLVTVTGGQVHGNFRDGSLLLRRTRGVRVQGLKLHEGARPVIVQASGALQLAPQVINLTRRTAAFAVACIGVYRADIQPMVLGAPGQLGGGVMLDAACNFLQVDTSAVDPGCFTGGAGARKLWFDGADAIGGAGAVGFVRRGNVVTGVLG